MHDSVRYGFKRQERTGSVSRSELTSLAAQTQGSQAKPTTLFSPCGIPARLPLGSVIAVVFSGQRDRSILWADLVGILSIETVHESLD